jgi:mannose/cellobiose epimerase-like protein (N-acyl-D-glucosamine 2-epimerase family)
MQPISHDFTQGLTLLGTVTRILPVEDSRPGLELKLRSGDTVAVRLMPTSWIATLSNLDRLDRSPAVEGVASSLAAALPGAARYSPRECDDLARLDERLREVFGDGGVLAAVEGTYYVDGGSTCFDASIVHVLHSHWTHPTNPSTGRYLFEHTAWWNVQIQAMADQWLDSLFGDRRDYRSEDFAGLYRTNLNILGLPTDDESQEMATLSRLIYGLSSAYLLTGQDRYLAAAEAGVAFQRDAFRLTSADGRFCLWAHARRKRRYGTRKVIPSEASDDAGTIPLYEQIYALAGLSHYYRITLDPLVLHDIRRTVIAFRTLYHDDAGKGFYSHIDYATFRSHDPKLGKNRSRKNWNSVGDHVPAYLIDLILALDPLPPAVVPELEDLLDWARTTLNEISDIINAAFPDPDPSVPYVRERFHVGGPPEEWTYDGEWDWQQDRGVVGHNLKIAWNLSRIANYHDWSAATAEADGDMATCQDHRERSAKLDALARLLGNSMEKVGIDRIRGGCFDTVERRPRNGMKVQFPWRNTKDFWQQEQAILAYLILHGRGGAIAADEVPATDYLALAREMEAFWNLFFLDRERSGIFFRTTADGVPVIEGHYGNKGGHSISGYHAFELNFLAHLYQRSYLDHQKVSYTAFALSFRPVVASGATAINVLGDFVQPGVLRIVKVAVNGVARELADMPAIDRFQVPLRPEDLGARIEVRFERVAAT